MGWVTKNTALRHRTGYFYNGKEIALHKERGYSPKKRFKGNLEHYPEKVQFEVAALWAVMRSVERVHQIMDIPKGVINAWMREPWWDNIVSQVRKEKNEELDAAMTEVIHKTVDVLKDRLENGEVYRDRRTGDEFRVPVDVKTASRALEVTFKERQLLRGEATATVSTVSSETKLKQLADQFEKMAIRRKTQTLEAEYVDVSGTGEGQALESEASDRPEEPSEGETSEGTWEQVDGLQTESETETEEVRFHG